MLSHNEKGDLTLSQIRVSKAQRNGLALVKVSKDEYYIIPDSAERPWENLRLKVGS